MIGAMGTVIAIIARIHPYNIWANVPKPFRNAIEKGPTTSTETKRSRNFASICHVQIAMP